MDGLTDRKMHKAFGYYEYSIKYQINTLFFLNTKAGITFNTIVLCYYCLLLLFFTQKYFGRIISYAYFVNLPICIRDGKIEWCIIDK